MAPKSSASPPSATRDTHPIRPQFEGESFSEWLARSLDQGVQPDQALAVIGLGLMRRMAAGSPDAPWVWNEEEDGARVDAAGLRQRLELIQLALETGAPLSTAEITLLLGARPGGALVRRGGLTARRLSRNVWKLTRGGEEGERSETGFRDGFRRRL